MEENIQQKRQAHLDKLITRDDLLKENDYKFESPIPRYIAFECGDDEVAMWAIQEDDLTSLARSIDESSTKAAEIWAYDLDTGERLLVCQRVVSFVTAKTQERIDIPAPVAPRAFISIENGLVHDVAADCPLRLRIIDYDTEYSTENNIVSIPQGDGKTEPGLLGERNADYSASSQVDEIFAIKLQ